MADTISIEINQWRKIEQALKVIIDGSGVASSSSAGQNTNRKTKQAVDEAVKGNENLADSADSASKTLSGIAKKLNSGYDKLDRAQRSYENRVTSSYDAMSQFEKAMGSSSGSLKKQSAILGGLIEGTNLTNEALDKHATKLINASKSLQLLNKSYGSQIKSINQLNAAQEQLARNANFIEKAFDDVDDLAAEIEKITKLHADVRTKEQQNLLDIVKGMKLKKLDNESLRESVAIAKTELKSLQTRAYANLKMTEAMNHVEKSFGGVVGMFKGSIGPLSVASAGLAMFGAGLKGAWEQFKVIADSGMINSWTDIKTAQMSLGISLEQATKMYQDNARIVHSIGGKAFGDTIGNVQNSLVKYGVSVESAAMIGENAVKNAAIGGVDIRDKEKLAKVTKMQADAFLKLHATTGLSADEFKSMNDEMIGSIDIQSTLNGLNQIDRMNKIQDLTKVRQEFINLGMSAQGAQKTLMDMQNAGKAKVSDRFSQSAKLQQSLMQAGVGNAGRIAQLHRIGLDNLSADEKKEYMQGLKEYANKRDKVMTGRDNYQSQNVYNKLDEGVDQNLLDSARKMNLGAQANGQLTEADVNKKVEESKINETAAAGMKAEKQMEQFLNDPLAKLIGGLALTTIAVMNLATRLGGGATLDNIVNAIKNSSASTQEEGPKSYKRSHQDGINRAKKLKQRKLANGKRSITRTGHGKTGAMSSMAKMVSAVEDSSGCCCGDGGSSLSDYGQNQKKNQRGRINDIKNGKGRNAGIRDVNLENVSTKPVTGRTGSTLKKVPNLGGVAASIEADAATVAKASRMSKIGGALKAGIPGALKGGVAGIVGGLAIDFAKDKLAESGHDQMSAAADVASDALSSASYGAMLGSFIPGLGTAIGGAIGAAVGGGMSLFNGGFAKIFGTSDKPEVTVTPTKTSSEFLNMSDNYGAGNLLSQAQTSTSASTPIAAVSAAAVVAKKVVDNQQTHTLGELSSKDSSSSTAKSPLTAEQLLTKISEHLEEIKTSNKDLSDTSTKQLDMIESLVITNKEAYKDYQYRTKGHLNAWTPDTYSQKIKNIQSN
jgi:hypothetical protein